MENQKEKAKNMPKTSPREETASVGSQKANVHLEKHAHSSVARTRTARAGPRSPSPTGSPHRNSKTRRVTENVAMTEVLKTATFARKRGEVHVIVGMFPHVQNSKRQVDAHSETSVHTNTQRNLLMKREIQHRLLFTFRRMMNDRCNS